MSGFKDTDIVGLNRPIALEDDDFTVYYDWLDGIYGQAEPDLQPLGTWDVTSIAGAYQKMPRIEITKVRKPSRAGELVTMKADPPL